MLVEDLMSTDVVTVPADATVRTAVERLLAEGVGSVVVVTDAGNPGGLVTQTDVLEALYETGVALDELDVADLTHRPVVTTDPSTTISHLADRMAAKGVKKAPVMDDLDLVGIVTMTDIVWHLSEIRKEVSDRGAAHSRWSPTH